MFKYLNTSLWMNFTSNPFLQYIFHQFYLEMPPMGVKTCICESQNSHIFVKWFDGKKIIVIAFFTTFPHCVLFSKTVTFTKFLPKSVSETKILQFPHCAHCAQPHCTVWKNEKFGLTEKIFRQINSP